MSELNVVELIIRMGPKIASILLKDMRQQDLRVEEGATPFLVVTEDLMNGRQSTLPNQTGKPTDLPDVPESVD